MRVARKGPSKLMVAYALAAAYVLWHRGGSPPKDPSINEPYELDTTDALCDPFEEPGFLHYDSEKPKQARWIPYSSSCEPAPDWIALIAARNETAMHFLINRTILVLGDSVDRNGLEHMAVMLGLPRYSVPYDDFSLKGTVPDGWDYRGVPWVIEIPWFNTTFTNGFFYGLDDEDNFRQQPDWHPPGKAEERIDKLFKVHSDQLPQAPSFISLHSGLWDLAFFGRQDRVSGTSSEVPLSAERMDWWRRRMTSVIGHVQETWPGVPIWMRKLHRVGPVEGASHDWRHNGKDGEDTPKAGFSNFFTDVRIHRIREAQEQVARDTGVPSFDFGEVWEGWQGFQDKVHPHIFPGGPVYVQALIHHIWMESVPGRDKWKLAKTRPLATLTPGVEKDEGGL